MLRVSVSPAEAVVGNRPRDLGPRVQDARNGGTLARKTSARATRSCRSCARSTSRSTGAIRRRTPFRRGNAAVGWSERHKPPARLRKLDPGRHHWGGAPRTTAADGPGPSIRASPRSILEDGCPSQPPRRPGPFASRLALHRVATNSPAEEIAVKRPLGLGSVVLGAVLLAAELRLLRATWPTATRRRNPPRGARSSRPRPSSRPRSWPRCRTAGTPRPTRRSTALAEAPKTPADAIGATSP